MQCRVIGIWGGFPKKNGPSSGFLVQKDGFSLLIDCGSGVAQQLQNYVDLNEINHVVLSHYHYDHFRYRCYVIFQVGEYAIKANKSAVSYLWTL